MKKIGTVVFSFLIAFFIFFVVVKWTGWQEIRNAFNIFLSYQGFVLVLLSLLIWIIGAFKWQLILASQNYHFPFLKLLEIYFAGFSFTYLTPVALIGGEGVRAYALKSKFSIPWGKNISVLVIEKILSFFALLVFLLFGLFSFVLLSSLPLKYLEILVVLIFLFSVLIFLFLFFKLYKKERLINLILKVLGVKNNDSAYNFTHDIFSFFNPKDVLFWKICLVSFLRYLVIFLRAGILLFFLTQNKSFLVAGSVMLFIYLSYLVPLPAGIGSLEAAQTFIFGYLGFGAIQGVTFSIILRSAELFIAAFGIVCLFKLGTYIFFNVIKNIFKNERQIKENK